MPEEPQTQTEEIHINVKGPNELKLQLTITTDKTVRDLKEAIAEKSDVEADRQRLIYSGRVLKDDDTLSTYKIQSSHTIHMVKGAARSAASTSRQPAAPQALPSMQAGQNPHDPLTQLNSHMGYGAMAGLNPFSELGLNPNDPNMLQTMMSSPQFLQQMSSVMSNPAVLDQIIASNPQLAAMGPQVRQVFQSEQFRQMMSNPDSLRSMLQMASMMRELGPNNPFGAPPSFPAPGNPVSGGNTDSSSPASQQSGQPQPDLTSLFSLFAPGGSGVPPQAPAGTGTGGLSTANPFGLDPAMMQQLIGGMGAGSPFGGGGFGMTSAPPADTRPPEERFQVQLQQLQDMGFTNASQNIRALLATGGNVNSAIEYILTGGGL